MRDSLNLVVASLCFVSFGTAVQAQDSVEVFIPPPITDLDLQAAKQLLMLSDAQVAIVGRLHTDYIEEWKALHDANEPQVRAAGFEAGSLFLTENGEFGQSAVDAVKRMEELRSALNTKSSALDRALWSQLEPLLAETQTPALARVKQHRARDRCRLTHRALPIASVDLARILRTLQIEAPPGGELDLLLSEYDSAVTGPWLELDEYLAKSESEEFQAAVDLLFVNQPAGHVLIVGDDPYTARIRSLAKPALRLQHRIATLNRVFSSQIAVLLPDEQSARFRDTYDRVGFPSVYPDPFDPSDVFARLMLAPNVPETIRPVLRGMWHDYRESYKALCRSLENKENERLEEFASTRGSVRMGVLQEEVQQIRQVRWERSKAFVESLFAAMPSEVSVSYRFLKDEYFNHEASYRRALESVGRRP